MQAMLQPRSIAVVLRHPRFVCRRALHYDWIARRAAAICAARGHFVTCLHAGRTEAAVHGCPLTAAMGPDVTHVALPPPPPSAHDGSRDWFRAIVDALPPIVHATVDATGPFAAEDAGVYAAAPEYASPGEAPLSARDIFTRELVPNADCTVSAIAFHSAQMTQLAWLAQEALEAERRAADNTPRAGRGGDNDDNNKRDRGDANAVAMPVVVDNWFVSDFRLLKSSHDALLPLLSAAWLAGERGPAGPPPPGVDSESFVALTSPRAAAKAVADHSIAIDRAGMRCFSTFALPPLLAAPPAVAARGGAAMGPPPPAEWLGALPVGSGLAPTLRGPVPTLVAAPTLPAARGTALLGGWLRPESWSPEFHRWAVVDAAARHLPTPHEAAWFLADRVGPPLRWLAGDETGVVDGEDDAPAAGATADSLTHGHVRVGASRTVEAEAVQRLYDGDAKRFARRVVGVASAGNRWPAAAWDPRLLAAQSFVRAYNDP